MKVVLPPKFNQCIDEECRLLGRKYWVLGAVLTPYDSSFASAALLAVSSLMCMALSECLTIVALGSVSVLAVHWMGSDGRRWVMWRCSGMVMKLNTIEFGFNSKRQSWC